MFIYQDSKFDLTTVYRVHSKIDLPLGTEKTFILVDNEDGADFKWSDDSDFLLNRYIEFISPTTATTTYIPIVAYNSTTGQVTIESAFGEAIETTDVFNLVILDALYITNGNGFQSHMKAISTEEKLSIYLHLQTKEDSLRNKMFDYIYLIKSSIIKLRKRLKIYNDDGDVCGYMEILSSIDDDPTQNDDNQIQTSLVSFTVSYTINYLK